MTINMVRKYIDELPPAKAFWSLTLYDSVKASLSLMIAGNTASEKMPA